MFANLVALTNDVETACGVVNFNTLEVEVFSRSISVVVNNDVSNARLETFFSYQVNSQDSLRVEAYDVNTVFAVCIGFINGVHSAESVATVRELRVNSITGRHIPHKFHTLEVNVFAHTRDFSFSTTFTLSVTISEVVNASEVKLESTGSTGFLGDSSLVSYSHSADSFSLATRAAVLRGESRTTVSVEHIGHTGSEDESTVVTPSGSRFGIEFSFASRPRNVTVNTGSPIVRTLFADEHISQVGSRTNSAVETVSFNTGNVASDVHIVDTSTRASLVSGPLDSVTGQCQLSSFEIKGVHFENSAFCTAIESRNPSVTISVNATVLSCQKALILLTVEHHGLFRDDFACVEVDSDKIPGVGGNSCITFTGSHFVTVGDVDNAINSKAATSVVAGDNVVEDFFVSLVVDFA